MKDCLKEAKKTEATMQDFKWIILIGPPGCGKGTQAEWLISEKGFVSVSVGDLLRLKKECFVKSIETTIGSVIENGFLLPDDIVIDLVKDDLQKKYKQKKLGKILFDGFPRTVAQAVAVQNFANEFETDIYKVLNFVVTKEIVINRILGRFKCKKCAKIYNKFYLPTIIERKCDVCGSEEFIYRADDNENSLFERFVQYEEKTFPLLEFYSKKGLLCNIDAMLEIEKVRLSIANILDI